ncbi:MAG TPA: ABC transporter substrate-binding protein [Planctomycetota bacterium]|nr:ABC transporter substrate-binding protein [Planctomycetota bacterium]
MRAHQVLAGFFVLLAAASVALALRLSPEPFRVRGGLPRRIVANSPALAEIVYKIGAGNLVVARSRYAKFPPAILALPEVGGPFDPNYEAISTAKPDCLLVQFKKDVMEPFAASRGIRLEHFTIETIQDELAATLRVGELTGHEREAQAEVERLSGALAAARARARTQPRVLVSFGREPGEIRSVETAGRRTFAMECLEAAGGTSAFADIETGYKPVAKEAVVERRPEVVIELHGDVVSAELASRLVRDWEDELPDLPAVKNHRVVVVSHEAALTPGPRLDELVAAFERALRGSP